MLFGQLFDGLLQMVTLFSLMMQGLLPPPAVRFSYVQEVTTGLTSVKTDRVRVRRNKLSRKDENVTHLGMRFRIFDKL